MLRFHGQTKRLYSCYNNNEQNKIIAIDRPHEWVGHARVCATGENKDAIDRPHEWGRWREFGKRNSWHDLKPTNSVCLYACYPAKVFAGTLEGNMVKHPTSMQYCQEETCSSGRSAKHYSSEHIISLIEKPTSIPLIYLGRL